MGGGGLIRAAIATLAEGDALNLAESVRFELTDGCPSAVFKTAGLNHSPNSPFPNRGACL